MTASPSQTENFGIAARYYAPPTFTSRDPHFERYFWTTPYGYCNNNPLKYVDPTGMDWYQDADGNAVFNKNVNEKSQLGEGEKYIGKTASWMGQSENDMNIRYTGDENGNVTSRDMTMNVSADKINGNGYDVDKAVEYLNANAYPTYNEKICGHCAKAVRLAIEAGGVKTSNRPTSGSAKDYGPFLEQWGFRPIDNNSIIQKGDVRVIQNYPGGSKHGHMDMFNGERWVSDFLQNGFWPGAGYRIYQPSYQIYRYNL